MKRLAARCAGKKRGILRETAIWLTEEAESGIIMVIVQMKYISEEMR